MQRIVASLAPGVEAARVVAELRALGATDAAADGTGVTATAPDGDLGTFLAGASAIRGVTRVSPSGGDVEPDADPEPDAALLPDPGPGLEPGWSWTEPQ